MGGEEGLKQPLVFATTFKLFAVVSPNLLTFPNKEFGLDDSKNQISKSTP